MVAVQGTQTVWWLPAVAAGNLFESCKMGPIWAGGADWKLIWWSRASLYIWGDRRARRSTFIVPWNSPLIRPMLLTNGRNQIPGHLVIRSFSVYNSWCLLTFVMSGFLWHDLVTFCSDCLGYILATLKCYVAESLIPSVVYKKNL